MATQGLTVAVTGPTGDLGIAVVDKLYYSPPMYLSNYTRRADGSYTLGSVVTG